MLYLKCVCASALDKHRLSAMYFRVRKKRGTITAPQSFIYVATQQNGPISSLGEVQVNIPTLISSLVLLASTVFYMKHPGFCIICNTFTLVFPKDAKVHNFHNAPGFRNRKNMLDSITPDRLETCEANYLRNSGLSRLAGVANTES